MLALDDGPFESSGQLSRSRNLFEEGGSRYANILGESDQPKFFRKKRATMTDSRQDGQIFKFEGLKDEKLQKYVDKVRDGNNYRHKSVTRNLVYDRTPKARNENQGRTPAAGTLLPDINQKTNNNMLAYEDVLSNLPELRIGQGEMSGENPYQL